MGKPREMTYLRTMRFGLPKNPDEARHWYSKLLGCAIKDVSQAGRDRAAAWLRDHPA